MDFELWNLPLLGRKPKPVAPSDPLEGPRLKIERAKKHIRELDAKIARFFDGKPYRVVVKGGRNPQQHLWVVEIREHLPSKLAPVLGDAVHNLWSALDLLACACVKANNRGISGVYFPKADSSKGMKAAIEDANVHKASKQVVAIFEGLEVYPGGKHEGFIALSKLDTKDKHRLLLPVVGLASFNEVLHIGGEVIYPNLDKWLFNLENGATILATDKVVYKKEIGDEINATFHVAFGEGQPLYGSPLIPTLKNLVSEVEAVVSLFVGLL